MDSLFFYRRKNMSSSIKEIVNKLNFKTVIAEINKPLPFNEIKELYKGTEISDGISNFIKKCVEEKYYNAPLTRSLINELGIISEECGIKIGYYNKDNEQMVLFFCPNLRTDEWMMMFKQVSTRRQFFDFIHTFKNTKPVITMMNCYNELNNDLIDMYNKQSDCLTNLIHSRRNKQNRGRYDYSVSEQLRRLDSDIISQELKVHNTSKYIERLKEYRNNIFNVSGTFQYNVPYGNFAYKLEKTEIDDKYIVTKFVNEYEAPYYKVMKFDKGINYTIPKVSYNKEEFECLKMEIEGKKYKGSCVKSLKENGKNGYCNRIICFKINSPINRTVINSKDREEDICVYCKGLEHFNKIKYCTYDFISRKLLFTETEVKDCVFRGINNKKDVYTDKVFSDEEIRDIRNSDSVDAITHCKIVNNLLKHEVNIIYAVNVDCGQSYSNVRLVDNFIYDGKQYVIFNNGVIINVTDIEANSLSRYKYFNTLDMDVFHMSKENNGYYISFTNDYIEYYRNEDLRNYLITLVIACNNK